MTLSRKSFLHAGLTLAAVNFLGCSDDAGTDGMGGSGSGTGGTGGAGTGGAANGTGGAANGTGATDSGTGGDQSGSGGTGAGGDGGEGPVAGTGATGGQSICGAVLVVRSSTASGHFHTLIVPLSVINAGIETTLQTEPLTAMTHCHQITLTVQDLAIIKGGGVVTKFSCNGGNHEFKIGCGLPAAVPAAPTECGNTSDMRGACPM